MNRSDLSLLWVCRIERVVCVDPLRLDQYPTRDSDDVMVGSACLRSFQTFSFIV